ncbi:MAG: AI-2E family transporter [Allosphingosinicella sp.]|uniref:AI-2E family transporter n=1 Tax=Allosphingosinicella sp. TaxID=2823234 RepID=UPI0039526213
MDREATRASRAAPGSWLGVMLAAGSAIVVLWFLSQIVTAILLLFFALVVAIALSAPVDWMVGRGMRRGLAAALTLVAFFATLVLLGWLVFPQLARQVVLLLNGLPDLIFRINDQLIQLLARYPELQAVVRADAPGGWEQQLGATAMNLFRGVGDISLSLLGAIALLIIFLSAVMYVVLEPRPILRGYLGSLPLRHRAAGLRAYRRAARAVVGWTKASLIIGSIEFVLVFVYLSYMNVPAALVWAALAFFAEFIPRIGGYIMAFPPVVVALTISPMTAVWVALFYLAMNEILGSFLAPRIRGTTMQLHPVMLLFFTLAFALAFGLLGAIVATPAAAFVSAYYSEFYLRRRLKRPARRGNQAAARPIS